MPTDDRIAEAARTLALRFTDDADLPARFRRQTNASAKPREVKRDSDLEKRFRNTVESWARLIETMIAKLDHAQAWRFVHLLPQTDVPITKIMQNNDFSAFIDYLTLRRDEENCDADELGGLALLSVALQKEVERHITRSERTTASDRIVVIDVETTGLSPWRHDRVVEIGIVVISPDGAIHAEYDTLVNPQRDMGPTSIHRISAADVLRAPVFAGIAGDVLEILASADAVAGHNISFDMSFLIKEFERIGVALPQIPLLCTCRQFGRAKLQACCNELGIVFEGMPHRALADARATARVLSRLCMDDPSLLDAHRVRDVSWPSLSPLKTPRFCREHARQEQDAPPSFLERIAAAIHHDVEAQPPNVLAYMALIDRVLQDRAIDTTEEEVLVDAALNWQMSKSQLDTAHAQYLQSLAVSALADGNVSDSERRDLHLVARLLGQDGAKLDAVIENAAAQLATAHRSSPKHSEVGTALAGKSVCFTGKLQSTISGEPITRELAETLASNLGMVVASNVTKGLDILVVADPNTQSVKASKARDFGIRVLADVVFWKLAGVSVD